MSCVTSQLINAWPNKRLLDYRYAEQLRDMAPAILLACVMAACVRLVLLLGLSDWATLLIQVPLGVAVYIALSALLRVDSFCFMLSILRRFRDGRRTAAQDE